LLVSVRDATEVADALAGGADIIDAKEPARGSLGPVEPSVLAAIVAALPGDVPLSIALGDLRSVAAAGRALDGLAVSPRAAPHYVKLGFAGQRSEAAARRIIAAAVAACRERRDDARVVAVAYADHEAAGSPLPDSVANAAAEAGAAGVLLDTWIKDGRGLFTWMPQPRLHDWVARVRAAAMLAAVAGSLRPEGLGPVAAAVPDIVGVRGAVCAGGRRGRIEREMVRRVKSALAAEVVIT
jgi:uncharacterized protein (UPF0264 family)